MVFEEFARSIESNKQKLAANLAAAVATNHISSYRDIPPEELARQFLPHFEMTVQYIREGNPTLWRDYYSRLVSGRFRAGFTFESVITVSKAHYDVLYQFVDEQWPAARDERLNQKYRQRVQGMQTLSETTIRLVYLSKSYLEEDKIK